MKSYGNHLDEAITHREIARRTNVGILEIGVLNGDTSAIFCEYAPSHVPIIGIDPIIPDSMNPDLLGSLNSIISKTRQRNNYTFYQEYSYNVLPYLLNTNQHFDYIFIDGDHKYSAVREDFMLSHDLLVNGGILAIHDSTATRGGPMHWPGPSRLADEILSKWNESYEHLASPYCMTVFRKIKD
jgi:predicted O-methyltransferase YrrM